MCDYNIVTYNLHWAECGFKLMFFIFLKLF